jgi:adenosine deaminase
VPLPSVLLHDHLDGGLRPSTILELADETGYHDLPAGTVEDLSSWFDQSESGFNISTDNRLMSKTSMSAELVFGQRHHGFGVDDLATVVRNSLAAAFCGRDTEVRLWEQRIAPAYREAGARVEGKWHR